MSDVVMWFLPGVKLEEFRFFDFMVYFMCPDFLDLIRIFNSTQLDVVGK